MFRCFKSSCRYCLFSSLETVLTILQVCIMMITQSRPSEFKTNHRFDIQPNESLVCWVTRQISCVRVDGMQNGKITFHTNQKRGKKMLTHRVFIWRQTTNITAKKNLNSVNIEYRKRETKTSSKATCKFWVCWILWHRNCWVNSDWKIYLIYQIKRGSCLSNAIANKILFNG